MRPSSLVLAAAFLLLALPVLARPRRPRVRYEDPRDARPSATYAAMGKTACLRALSARKIAFSAVDKAPGVVAPVRLAGDVAGVVYRTDAPAIERASSPAEVYDCRLVLALADFGKVLAAHGIDEVRTASAWRPKRARTTDRPGKRHGGALAVDIERFGKKLAPGEKTKRWLSVASDFRARIGEPLCAASPRTALPAAAKELRAIACEARDCKAFTSILTPAYDRAHRDHIHVEIRPGVTWSLFL